jgi:hypothetical protein
MRPPGPGSVPSRMRNSRRRFANLDSEHRAETLLAAVDVPCLYEILVDPGRVAEEPTVDPDGDDIVCYTDAFGVIDIHTRACADPTPRSITWRWRFPSAAHRRRAKANKEYRARAHRESRATNLGA